MMAKCRFNLSFLICVIFASCSLSHNSIQKGNFKNCILISNTSGNLGYLWNAKIDKFTKVNLSGYHCYYNDFAIFEFSDGIEEFCSSGQYKRVNYLIEGKEDLLFNSNYYFSTSLQKYIGDSFLLNTGTVGNNNLLDTIMFYSFNHVSDSIFHCVLRIENMKIIYNYLKMPVYFGFLRSDEVKKYEYYCVVPKNDTIFKIDTKIDGNPLFGRIIELKDSFYLCQYFETSNNTEIKITNLINYKTTNKKLLNVKNSEIEFIVLNDKIGIIRNNRIMYPDIEQLTKYKTLPASYYYDNWRF